MIATPERSQRVRADDARQVIAEAKESNPAKITWKC